jgi:cytochrome c oxidase cbb3-type subunit 1
MATDTDSASPGDVQLRADIDRSLRHPVMFFFTSGAAWLAVALVLGLIASIKTHNPEFLDGSPWLSTGRVYAAHLNALVYGWGCQAAFGMIIWLMARLSRKECRNAGTILTAGHLWNFGVTVGVLGVLGGMGTGMPWMEFPAAVWPILLLSYIFIAIWSVIQFRCREGGHVYISQWYLLGAIFWFPWVFFTAHFFIFAFDGHPLMDAAINSWFKGTLIFLFFVPVGIAAAYYLAPKITGRPIYSYNLAVFGFWALAVIGPWAGMQKLAGAPIPQFLPYVGAAATILFFIPILMAGVNILKTVAGHEQTIQASPTLRFTVSGLVGLIILGALGVVLNWTPALKLTQFSMTGYGYEILAMYGFFSMCAFAAIYFVVPRITRREWLSSRFIRWHYYLSLYGVATVILCSLFGGLTQGPAIEAWDEPWKSAATMSSAWGVGIALAWAFLLISNVFFFLHLLLMWARLGRRSQHPTLLRKPTATHRPDGDLDKPQAANA